MHQLSLRGLGIALVTPFDADKQVDYQALARIVNYVIDNGADYIVVLGTTGETPTLTASEKEIIRHFVAKENRGRIPLVLGMGSNNTMGLVEEIKNTDFDGYSAILSIVPFYNKPTQEGIYRHFAEVAKASPLPVVLYNVPGRTGVNMTAETTLRLAREFPNIIAVKEASGNMKQIEDIISNCPDDFEVISGDDGLTYALISMGAKGVISVVGNGFPCEFGKMVHLCLNGDFEAARTLHYAFRQMNQVLFVDGNPAGIKYLLADMGLCRNELRLPLVPASAETAGKIDHILKALRQSPYTSDCRSK